MRDPDDLSAVMTLRIEMLERILPLTPIAVQCRIERVWLEVRGLLGTYRIQIPSGGVVRVTGSGFQFRIPLTLLENVPLDLSAFPIDLDHRTATVLRKAYILANDWKIDSPDLIRQSM